VVPANIKRTPAHGDAGGKPGGLRCGQRHAGVASRIGSVSNTPTTFMLDGRQYILAAAGDTLYAFAIYE
jgi:alcohol dehydrogenase (cytochrome c)